MRIRQIALVAEDLDSAEGQLSRAFDLGPPFHDPGVEIFGLRNAVFAVGDTFLEVVCPLRDDASAARFREKRGGDGGYMVIVQTDDPARARTRVAELGVRIVFETSFPDIATMHLHPKDTGGILLSIDWAEPAESWRWGGEDWPDRVRTDRVERIVGVDIACRSPRAVAARWGRILDLPLAQETPATLLCPRDGGCLRFVDCLTGEAEGIRTVHLATNDAESILRAAKDPNGEADESLISLLGTRFELRPG